MFTDPIGTAGLTDFFVESEYKNIDFFNEHIKNIAGHVRISLILMSLAATYLWQKSGVPIAASNATVEADRSQTSAEPEHETLWGVRTW
jgi:hypothetical protein